jgi:hypothetical protein
MGMMKVDPIGGELATCPDSFSPNIIPDRLLSYSTDKDQGPPSRSRFWACVSSPDYDPGANDRHDGCRRFGMSCDRLRGLDESCSPSAKPAQLGSQE